MSVITTSTKPIVKMTITIELEREEYDRLEQALERHGYPSAGDYAAKALLSLADDGEPVSWPSLRAVGAKSG